MFYTYYTDISREDGPWQYGVAMTLDPADKQVCIVNTHTLEARNLCPRKVAEALANLLNTKKDELWLHQMDAGSVDPTSTR